MICMPLIDEAVNLLDNNLMDRIANNFTSRNGLIIDNDGNCWYRWRSDGLDSWWRFFEEIIDAPMGRKLVNSACDEEEWLLNSGELDHSGLFRKKKIKLALIDRWALHGWGVPNLKPPSFDSSSLKPLFAGILQADIERINSMRYRMLWEEKSAETALLTLNETNLPVPNAKSSYDVYQKGESLQIEVEKGWRIDGLKFILLPVGLFKRLEESCAGLVAKISDDERKSWPQVTDGFLALALAAKKLFIAGEEIFLAADAQGWMDSCESYFAPRGLASPISVNSIDSNGGIELLFKEIPLPSITVGYLAGAWVRCEGRPVKVELNYDDNRCHIRLQSRYEIS